MSSRYDQQLDPQRSDMVHASKIGLGGEGTAHTNTMAAIYKGITQTFLELAPGLEIVIGSHVPGEIEGEMLATEGSPGSQRQRLKSTGRT